MFFWSFRVPEHCADRRADILIFEAVKNQKGDFSSKEKFPSLSRTQVKKLIESNLAQANGQFIKSKTKINPGTEITLQIPKPKPLETKPQPIQIEVLFEDPHLLVVNKPTGLTVHPSETQTEDTLVNALLFHIKDLSGIGGVLRPGIVHRLDKFTSGVMVVCKTNEAHLKLTEVFSKHDIVREYIGFCYGSPDWEKTHLETQIGRNPKDRKKMCVLRQGGRKAVSTFEVMHRYASFASQVKVRLQTGRTHQIRVHLTHLGHSLLGDAIYGKPSFRQEKWNALPQRVQGLVKALPGQALHAQTLGFAHPITGENHLFEVPPPSPLIELEETLKSYGHSK